MTPKPVHAEIAPGVFSLDGTAHALRTLIRDRDAAVREIAEIDAQMLGFRQRYAAERGEYLLPTLDRLRRELLGA